MREARKIRKTLLLVGEGDTEEAFLKYLRSRYCTNGQGVNATVCNAHGKGPQHVVVSAIRQSRNADYDRVVVLMDTDIPWDAETLKQAESNDIVLVGSQPCVEGLLLDILEQPIPEASRACKDAIQKKIPGVDLTEAKNYQTHFSYQVLESARRKIAELDNLLKYIEGRA
jgi:hypothetical protein